jgi:parvulin-like peptidyl-prolyl isomerase
MFKKGITLLLVLLFCTASIVFAVQSAKQKTNGKGKNVKTKTVNVKKTKTPLAAPDTVAAKNASPVVAEYTGGVITRADVEQRVTKIPAQYQPQYQTTQGMEKILDMMATEIVFYQKALSEGLDKKPENIKKMDDALKPLYMQEYYTRNIQKRVNITEKDKENYYDQNKLKYYENPNTTILYIQATDKKEADKALAALNKNTAFAEVVKTYSTNKYSKDLQGKIKNIRNNGYIPGVGNDTELDSLIMAAPVDSMKIIGPVKTKNGYHIFKVMSRIPGKQKTYVEVAGEIENKVRPVKENELTTMTVDSLKTAYKVKINQTVLDSLNEKNFNISKELMSQKLTTAKDPSLEMTAQEFLDLLKTISPQEQAMFMKGKGKTQFLDQVLTRNLFALEAKKLNYEQYVTKTDSYEQTRKYVLLQQIYTQLVIDKIKITNEDKQSYYEKNKETFAIQPTRKIQQLTFNKEAEAKKMRPKFLALLKKNKQDAILEMIRKSSIKPEQDGIIDNIYRNYIIPGIGTDSTYNKMVWDAKLNETSPIFKNSKGNYVFFTLLADNPLTYRSFNEVEPRIDTAIRKEKEKSMRESVTAELLKEFKFKKYPERLDITRTAKEYFDLADTAAKNGKFTDAISNYDEIIKRYPNGVDDYKAMFMKGFLQAEELKRTNDAISTFETFLNKFKTGELNESAKFMLEELKKGTPTEEIPVKNKDAKPTNEKE